MSIEAKKEEVNNGDSNAFPAPHLGTGDRDYLQLLAYSPGMTKREYIATQIMANLSHLTFDQELAAQCAVSAADELLAALART